MWWWIEALLRLLSHTRSNPPVTASACAAAFPSNTLYYGLSTLTASSDPRQIGKLSFQPGRWAPEEFSPNDLIDYSGPATSSEGRRAKLVPGLKPSEPGKSILSDAVLPSLDVTETSPRARALNYKGST